MITEEKLKAFKETLNDGTLYNSLDDELLSYQHTLVQKLNEFNRSDDTPEIIEKRIANYFAQTKPLEEYYAAKGLLRHINGMDTVENISEEICRIIAEEMEK